MLVGAGSGNHDQCPGRYSSDGPDDWPAARTYRPQMGPTTGRAIKISPDHEVHSGLKHLSRRLRRRTTT
jgi:hypothetical protein